MIYKVFYQEKADEVPVREKTEIHFILKAYLSVTSEQS